MINRINQRYILQVNGNIGKVRERAEMNVFYFEFARNIFIDIGIDKIQELFLVVMQVNICNNKQQSDQ